MVAEILFYYSSVPIEEIRWSQHIVGTLSFHSNRHNNNSTVMKDMLSRQKKKYDVIERRIPCHIKITLSASIFDYVATVFCNQLITYCTREMMFSMVLWHYVTCWDFRFSSFCVKVRRFSILCHISDLHLQHSSH